jgi:hypothetical protein
MALRKLAAAAALAAFATPGAAFDLREAGASTQFYISIPLEFGLSRKERQWSAGLQLQGKRAYQAVTIDSSVLNFISEGDIDGKLIVAGLVAVGAAAAIGGKGKGTSQTPQQQTQTDPQQGGTCTRPPADPCAP